MVTRKNKQCINNKQVKSIGFGPLPLDDSGIQRYERNVITRQERFKRCGVGHRLWPAATVLSRWIYEHKDIFHDKKVIECKREKKYDC